MERFFNDKTVLTLYTNIYKKAGVTINGSDDLSLGSLCIYLIALIAFLIIIFLIYFYYFRKQGLKKGKRHRCNYCGELVEVMSDCCQAPVIERFLIGTCRNCGKGCKIICSRCKKHIVG